MLADLPDNGAQQARRMRVAVCGASQRLTPAGRWDAARQPAGTSPYTALGGSSGGHAVCGSMTRLQYGPYLSSRGSLACRGRVYTIAARSNPSWPPIPLVLTERGTKLPANTEDTGYEYPGV
jgi:hypothetical protein